MKQLKRTYKGHEYVDLGLPSGTLWATCNVGAKTPYESGKYFQWGDVEGRYADELKEKPCKWETTPWGYERPPMEVLDAKHDAVTVNWGRKWRMPTKEDFEELMDNTTATWETNFNGSGVNGYKFISKKDPSKYIFILAAGYAYDVSFNGQDIYGFVWSSSLNSSFLDCACDLRFSSVYMGVGFSKYYYGHSVRGVIG